jgi:hypothetical protein
MGKSPPEGHVRDGCLAARLGDTDQIGVGVSQPYRTEIGHRGGLQVLAEAELQGADADPGRGGDVAKTDRFAGVILAIAGRTPKSGRSPRGGGLAEFVGVIVGLGGEQGVQQELLQVMLGQLRGREGQRPAHTD